MALLSPSVKPPRNGKAQVMILQGERQAKETSYEYTLRASGMAQWVKGPAAKPADLSTIPGTYLTKGDNQVLQVVLCLLWG